MTQGFTAAAMVALTGEQGYLTRYEVLLGNHMDNYPFAEFYNSLKLVPRGVKNLCFSAGSYLVAGAAQEASEQFVALFERYLQVLMEKAEVIARELATEIVEYSDATVFRVGGESGCGKTTLAKAIVDEFSRIGKRQS